jgi:hypothetical protein
MPLSIRSRRIHREPSMAVTGPFLPPLFETDCCVEPALYRTMRRVVLAGKQFPIECRRINFPKAIDSLIHARKFCLFPAAPPGAGWFSNFVSTSAGCRRWPRGETSPASNTAFSMPPACRNRWRFLPCLRVGAWHAAGIGSAKKTRKLALAGENNPREGGVSKNWNHANACQTLTFCEIAINRLTFAARLNLAHPSRSKPTLLPGRMPAPWMSDVSLAANP